MTLTERVIPALVGDVVAKLLDQHVNALRTWATGRGDWSPRLVTVMDPPC